MRSSSLKTHRYVLYTVKKQKAKRLDGPLLAQARPAAGDRIKGGWLFQNHQDIRDNPAAIPTTIASKNSNRVTQSSCHPQFRQTPKGAFRFRKLGIFVPHSGHVVRGPVLASTSKRRLSHFFMPTFYSPPPYLSMTVSIARSRPACVISLRSSRRISSRSSVWSAIGLPSWFVKASSVDDGRHGDNQT